jgi:hypothetical protein
MFDEDVFFGGVGLVRTGWEMVGKAWSAVCSTPAMERSCTRGAESTNAVRHAAVNSPPCWAAHACDTGDLRGIVHSPPPHNLSQLNQTGPLERDAPEGS